MRIRWIRVLGVCLTLAAASEIASAGPIVIDAESMGGEELAATQCRGPGASLTHPGALRPGVPPDRAFPPRSDATLTLDAGSLVRLDSATRAVEGKVCPPYDSVPWLRTEGGTEGLLASADVSDGADYAAAWTFADECIAFHGSAEALAGGDDAETSGEPPPSVVDGLSPTGSQAAGFGWLAVAGLGLAALGWLWLGRT